MKGIIYKIECNETGEVYYGSTNRSLNTRMIEHKAGLKTWKQGKRNFTTSFNIIERGNYSYSLIETVECEDKTQLEAREKYYIENNQCINKVIVGRTQIEYISLNRQAIRDYQKTYEEANKDLIKVKRRERYLKQKELQAIQ